VANYVITQDQVQRMIDNEQGVIWW